MQRIFGLAQRGVVEEKSKECNAELRAQVDELTLLFDEAQADWCLKNDEWEATCKAGAFTFTFTFIEARAFHIHVSCARAFRIHAFVGGSQEGERQLQGASVQARLRKG